MKLFGGRSPSLGGQEGEETALRTIKKKKAFSPGGKRDVSHPYIPRGIEGRRGKKDPPLMRLPFHAAVTLKRGRFFPSPPHVYWGRKKTTRCLLYRERERSEGGEGKKPPFIC